jgi:streptogramin lyase
VSEISGGLAGQPALGTVLSPATSAVGFAHAGILNTASGITLDPSGNVWVANYTLTTGGVFEIVGAAAPTDTPIAKSLADGKVGVKP